MSDFQETQELFNDSPPEDPYTQQSQVYDFDPTTPPGSPSLLLLSSVTSFASNAAATSAATPAKKKSSKLPPLLPKSKQEKVEPITLKRSLSVDEVAKTRKKRRTAAQIKEDEDGCVGLLQTIPQACGTSWYNTTGGMAIVQPEYPMAPPFQQNNPHGPTTTMANWRERGVAVLQVAASLGNVWANNMREKMMSRTTLREEEGHIYNVVTHVDNMFHVFQRT